MIKYYIILSEYLKWIKTAEEKAKWWQKVKKFILLKGQLFYEKKKGQLTLVMQTYQVVIILYMIHNHPTGGH